jgi:hypothetical protein
LGKWWWARGTPKGFRTHSAFLAIHRLAIQLSPFNHPAIHRLANRFFTIQGSYSKISIR